jgi:Mg/Co/Ni transporter MgtE
MLEVGLKVVLVDPSVAAEVMLAKCSPAISATIFLRMAQVLDASTIRG